MPGIVQRAIKYYYYTAEMEKKGEQGKPEDFNVAQWLIGVKADPGLQRVIHLKNCDVRLDVLDKDTINGNEFYSARVYKVRDTNIPVKLADGHDAEPIELEEDEYIGEDLNILYDYQLNVCMIQRNRMSIGVSRLAEWAMKDIADYDILFRPLGQSYNIGKFRKKKIRSLDITMGNINEQTKGTALSDLIKGAADIGGLNVSISISVGRKRNRELSKDGAMQLIKEITDNREDVTRARVKVKDDDNAPIETVDLIDDLLNDIIVYNIEHKSTLDFRTEKQQMLQKYLERREEIAGMVNRR